MSNIIVKVVYALPNHQYILSLLLPKSSSVEQAIEASGILSLQPEIDLIKINKVGIFSKIISLKEPLSNGDRIEIYRPLLINPKDRIRLRTL
ncbi:RnfH family protein [Candidatus Palibaumannia cicadellinicola]|uniref:RnfH family protein n=1 Tax=Candidatus Palibaumannia cicadellinicola TaxID=186490 RepID=UPI00030C44AD|nr:RnfH family protein [Candidatus Baumannia cicadellinicola]MBS0032899.1 RnfH family protein [Candidatus Baumannia cicadellinicola]MCJ7462142.1 RnfH family protein [Candidatus Baumannia cicadellinicola]MCJ7462598.1 RnfH family protein [Candidatus Baumannia cicadellinicola]